MTRPEQLKRLVRDVPDFPQPGIIFRDITPILADKTVFREVIDLMSKHWVDKAVNHVAAIEARGFILGAAIAIRVNAGFIPIRTAVKMPRRVHSHPLQL